MDEEHGYFSVLRDPQSYLNLIYVLLAFPTGLAYFIALVVGISLGLGLAVICVGLPILIATFFMASGAVAVERSLANSFLGAGIEPGRRDMRDGGSVPDQVAAALRNPSRWRGLFFLVLKFPLGVISFTIAVFVVALAGGAAISPLAFLVNGEGAIYVDSEPIITTWPAAALAFVVGAALAPIALWVTNGLASGWRTLAQGLLGAHVADASAPDQISVKRKAPPRVVIEDRATPVEKPKRKRVRLADLLAETEANKVKRGGGPTFDGDA